MAAPNSAQIKPSGSTISRLAIQPNMHCGPPPLMVAIIVGMVMNGPMPIMLVMFNAVACSRPKRRIKCGSVGWFIARVIFRTMAQGPPRCGWPGG
jgi:hypothetical protein